MRRATGVALFALTLGGASVAPAEVLSGEPVAGGDPNATVDGWIACRGVSPSPPDCAALRSAAVAILGADLRALGSGGNFGPLPLLVGVLAKSPEPELRAAAADGIGMIGPTPAETKVLAAALNEPVPAVRRSAAAALSASGDEVARALAGRALNPARPKSFQAEPAPEVAKLHIAPYAGATNLRFATDIGRGKALFVSNDAPDKVAAFYGAKAKKKAMSLEEFAAAYSESQEEPAEEEASDDSGDDSGAQMPSADQMAQAMEMMTKMNQAMNSGKSVNEAAAEMGGAATGAESAANEYADEALYGAPRVIVLEEGTAFGRTRPTRYVVVFRDVTLGKTGLALHGPAVVP